MTRVDPQGVLARVAEQEVDVVLADLELSALSGPELAAVIRQQRAHADLPVVYLCRRELALDARLLEPPLASTEMFIYLHRKHAPLAGKLAAALAAMKQDGSYRRIFDETLAPLAARR